MNDFEKELEEFAQDQQGEEEKLPSLNEQKEIVAKLKQLEAEGKLTQEVLEQYFSKFYDKTDAPVH